MRTDSIFYKLFKTFPSAFFELINLQPSEANAYSFTSVELKQTAFRIDGVFLPVVNASDRPIYFPEVQFQKDTEFYARLFSQIFLYLRLNTPTKAWRAVVIFPHRSIEPIEIEPYQVLLDSQLVTRLYLNELGNEAEQSLGVGIIKLVVESDKQTPEYAKNLITRTRTELANTALMQQVLDLIETIVLYKLPRLSRQELIKMFELDTFDIKKTRIYEELKEEILDEVKQQARDEVIREVRNEARQEQTLEVVMRLLRRRIGNVDQQIQESISQLSVEQLENLAEALLDFATPTDLSTWLQNNCNQP
ncbi:Rpn family recombination-promoting nuclease/putative transposase [Nostoc sp. CENA67]|uniref:Rpn family recombination-promoting nuclease/putative transposase n=1 Tax=Amazonocrinis nigriterrae CENA67 TaxID=2794033 RepID=A0A8J7HZJ0_9NOST|nr:Rpn family recombination-promoting nuclease/putative transposase [Amazonocrinis nigriterrae]MBH8567135.1 Rpn family recombination-promoting nuclease/putative transposase [Amazonocrinis nigriterrae CENA67]